MIGPDAGQRLSKSECYKNALNDWVSGAVKEPNSLVTGSLLFILCCLPVISFGPAWLALTYYMGRRGDGVKASWREALSFSLKRCGLKAWLMGWSDFLAVALAFGDLLALWAMELPAPFRYFYGIILFLDGLYMVSGLYRYPALAREPNNRLSRIIVRGVLLAVGNLGWTALFFCVQLLLFIICAVTGVGLVFLYPGGLALLSHYAYPNMVRALMPGSGGGV